MDSGAYQYRRYLSGDDDGMVELVGLYKNDLMLFLNGYLKNVYVAEDVTEDTFFKLMIKKPHFTNKCSFKTWLFTIGRNLALDTIKKQAKFTDLSDDALGTIAVDEKSVEEIVLKKQDQIDLHRVMLKLPRQYGEVLYLAYFESLSNIEIAHIIHKTTKQVANLLYRAKDLLKEELIKEGFEYENAY